MFGTEYAPLSLVITSRLRFVSVCVTVTVAPGIAPPLVSVTLPTSEPYTACPAAALAYTTHSVLRSTMRENVCLVMGLGSVLVVGSEQWSVR